jgi:hypothetical protein
VALVSGVLSALLLLLRVEVALPARSPAAAASPSASSLGSNGHSIAALNRFRSTAHVAARRRIRPRAAWEDEGSDSSDGERDESDEDGGGESE